jgi:hypothetical protein
LLLSEVLLEEGAVGKETVVGLDLSTGSLHLSISILMSLSISYETLGHLPILPFLPSAANELQL